MARRKEKEEIVITVCEIESLQRKRGVDTLLRCDGKRLYSKARLGIWKLLETRRVYGHGQMPVVRRGRERIPSTLAMPRNAEVGGGAPEQVVTYQGENNTQGSTVNSAAEQRN